MSLFSITKTILFSLIMSCLLLATAGAQLPDDSPRRWNAEHDAESCGGEARGQVFELLVAMQTAMNSEEAMNGDKRWVADLFTGLRDLFGGEAECYSKAMMEQYVCMQHGGDPTCCQKHAEINAETCNSGASGQFFDGTLWASACGGEPDTPGGTRPGAAEECEDRQGQFKSEWIDDYWCVGQTVWGIDPDTGACMEGFNPSDCTLIPGGNPAATDDEEEAGTGGGL